VSKLGAGSFVRFLALALWSGGCGGQAQGGGNGGTAGTPSATGGAAGMTSASAGVAGTTATGGIGGTTSAGAGAAGTAAASGGIGGTAAATGGMPGAGGASSGLGGGSPIDCGLIGPLPPILTIVDGATDNPICDATFTVETNADASTAPDAGAYRCDGTTSYGCPAFSTTDVPQPCVFALLGLAIASASPANSYTVAVGAPGYLTTQVTDVAGGRAAICGFSPETPSQLTVMLFHEN
jgi:hypothetical protein